MRSRRNSDDAARRREREQRASGDPAGAVQVLADRVRHGEIHQDAPWFLARMGDPTARLLVGYRGDDLAVPEEREPDEATWWVGQLVDGEDAVWRGGRGDTRGVTKHSDLRYWIATMLSRLLNDYRIGHGLEPFPGLPGGSSQSDQHAGALAEHLRTTVIMRRGQTSRHPRGGTLLMIMRELSDHLARGIRAWLALPHDTERRDIRRNVGDADLRATLRAAEQGDPDAESRLQDLMRRAGCPHWYRSPREGPAVVGAPCEVDGCPISRTLARMPPVIREAHLTAVMASGHEQEPSAVYTAYREPSVHNGVERQGEWTISDNMDREGLVPVIVRYDDGTWWHRTWDGDVPLTQDPRLLGVDVPLEGDELPLQVLRRGWARHRRFTGAHYLQHPSENPPRVRRNMDERRRGHEREAQRTGSVEDEARVLVERIRAGELDPEHVNLAAALGDEAARRASPSWPASIHPSWCGMHRNEGVLRTDAQIALRPSHVSYAAFFAPLPVRLEVERRSFARSPGTSQGWVLTRDEALAFAGDRVLNHAPEALDLLRQLATYSTATQAEIDRGPRDWQADPEGPRTRAWARELHAQRDDLVALLLGRQPAA